MNAEQVAKEIVNDALVGLEAALAADGIAGQLAAGVLEQVRLHYFGSAPPAQASVANMAGGLVGAIVTAVGGEAKVSAILEAEYTAAEAAADAEAKAVLT